MMRVTPKPTDTEWSFKQPVKGLFARRYYDHDGSLGGGMRTLSLADLDWIDGLIAGGKFDADDLNRLQTIADKLREGETIDMWFEV